MVKFLRSRDDAEKFLSGAMLARRLTYFNDLEGDPTRCDPDDGLRAFRHISGKPAPTSPYLSHVGTVSAGGGAAPQILSMEISYTPAEAPYVICLSRIVSKHPDPARCLNQLAQQVRQAAQMGTKFGTQAVVIDNRRERTFLDMVHKAATDRGYEFSSEAVSYRTDEVSREPLDAFCKSARFAPENEFRIALMGGKDVGTDLHLDIGNLSGIAEVVPTKRLWSLQLRPG